MEYLPVLGSSIAAASAAAAAADDAADDTEDDDGEDDGADEDEVVVPIPALRDAILSFVVEALIAGADLKEGDACTMVVAFVRALIITLVRANLHINLAEIVLEASTDKEQGHFLRTLGGVDGEVHLEDGLLAGLVAGVGATAQPQRAVLFGEDETTHRTNFKARLGRASPVHSELNHLPVSVPLGLLNCQS